MKHALIIIALAALISSAYAQETEQIAKESTYVAKVTTTTVKEARLTVKEINAQIQGLNEGIIKWNEWIAYCQAEKQKLVDQKTVLTAKKTAILNAGVILDPTPDPVTP